MYWSIYVSMYQCMLVCNHVSMYVCIYVCMYRSIDLEPVAQEEALEDAPLHGMRLVVVFADLGQRRTFRISHRLQACPFVLDGPSPLLLSSSPRCLHLCTDISVSMSVSISVSISIYVYMTGIYLSIYTCVYVHTYI